MLVSNPVLSKVSTVPAAVTLISKTTASTIDAPGISGDGGGGGGGEPGQAANSPRTAFWHAVDTVACWALLQADWVAGASTDMMPAAAW
eukprot:scaffold33297_cov53-Phaeocystis_antarctica.AAC.3